MASIETSSALHKISKLINQLKRDEAIQLMNLHGDTVTKIKSLMDESGISSDQLQILLNQKPPKEKEVNKVGKRGRKKMESTHEFGSGDVVQ
jgi:hypothetical protein